MNYSPSAAVEQHAPPVRDWASIYVVRAMACQVVILLITFGSLYVIPTAEKYFKDFKLDLSLLTRILLSASNSHLIIVLGLVVSSAIAAMAPLRTEPVATYVVWIFFWCYMALMGLGLLSLLLPMISLWNSLT